MAMTFPDTPIQHPPTDKVEAALLWCKERWRLLVTVAVLLIVAVSGMNYWRLRAVQKEVDASALLFSSTQGQPSGSPEDVMARYPGTVAARLAALNVAKDAMGKKDWQKAITSLETATSSGEKGEIVTLIATELLAYAHEGAGEYAVATGLFQKLMNDEGWWDQGGALRGAVRCLRLAGRAEEARALVEKFEAKDEMADDKESLLIWMSHVDALATSSAPQSSQR